MAGKGYVHAFQIDQGHTLQIYQGSLVEVEVDVLVSSDDNYLSAGGGVSYALASAAGQEIREEYRKLVESQRPRIGDIVRTSAGALPCRYLYHAITVDFDLNHNLDEKGLRCLVVNLLNRATEDGIRSLGIPAIGTGKALFNLGRASEIIVEELLLRLVDTPVERVILALIGDEAEQLFYERVVRAQADRMASLALRRRETSSSNASPDPVGTVRQSPPAGSGDLSMTQILVKWVSGVLSIP
jgi:O-acetyl-ADP-ribose deacetylase (regulator of RNase III)